MSQYILNPGIALREWRLSTMGNGSLYDVDQGVEPDIVIDKLEHFYDCEAMTEFLNNLH